MAIKDQFLFFCTNVGNEKLLKEEIRVFYPDFNFSYSRKGFLTYKNKGINYDLDTISQLELTFSTTAGICLGQSKPNSLLEAVKNSCDEIMLDLSKCMIHSFSINTEFELPALEIFQKEVNEYAPINKTIIDIITLGEEEVWYGVHKVGKLSPNYPNSHIDIALPPEAPSKSYLKIAQAVELFHIQLNSTDGWFDFGSAPGGASYYLLSKGCKVWGVDTAKMDSIVMENSNYTHFSKAVQDLSQEDLPYRDIQWVHVDLNLNPKQAIKEVLRLCKKYSARLKGILFTVQMVKNEYVQNIEDFEDQFYDWGFTNVTSRQVPSHKNEYLILAKR
jgi:23S rRNA (cytidine2498-2'-O)-methyltransferase